MCIDTQGQSLVPCAPFGVAWSLEVFDVCVCWLRIEWECPYLIVVARMKKGFPCCYTSEVRNSSEQIACTLGSRLETGFQLAFSIAATIMSAETVGCGYNHLLEED